MTFRPAILASMLLPATLAADVLVNLDATTLPAGPLPFWNNAGTVGGSFTSQLDVPVVSAIGGVQCVTFDGVNDWYVGPPAPASVTGTANAVSIEVWARNPALADEETLIAWGRRGGPDGTNRSFNYGANAVFGAVGHWGAPDVGWGGQNPAAAQWHYLVYTYNGASTQVYADGLLKNSKATALNTHSVSTSGVPLPFVLANQNNADGSRTQQDFVGSLSIARVRVRNEVLSPAQIASTYQAEGASFLPPVIQSFRASAPTYLPGQSITLTWDTEFTDTVSIDNGIGTVNSTDGSIAIAPPAFPTTYTITAQSPRGTTTAQVTVAPFSTAELANRWSFNEASGNTLIDSVTGQNATIVDQTGGTPWSRLGGRVVLPGGVSGTAPYIDLPNFILSTKNEVTFEGWATINGSQNWSRLFDFGTGTAGELFAPGGTATGTEYLLLSAQTGANQAVKRFEIRDNGVSNLADVGDPATIGQEFHFAVVYDADGAAGQPQLRYYKNGTLLSTVNTSFRLQDILDVNNWLGRSNWTADANTNAAYNEFRVWNGALSAEALADTIAAGPDALPQMPRIEAFAVFPGTTIYRGDSVNLSYVVADPSGAGVTLSIDQGIGAVPGNSGFVTVAPTSSKTYTLSATSPAGTRTAPVTVTVLPSEPTAENVSVATPFQTAIGITLVASDPNTPAGALTYTIITPPASGTLSGNGSTRTYTPNVGFTGPDSFTYRANDGTSDSNLATVTILVDAPPTNPTNVLLSQADIKTSDTTGSFIARLQATDANAQDTHTFTLVSGAGDTHNAFFSIVNGQLIAQHDFAADLGQTISARIRVTDNTGRSFEKIITLPVVAPTRGIVINELHYNPPNNSVPVEYIELYNPLTTSVNLGGWRFTDGVDYTFPPNTSIAAGGYLVVSRDPAAMLAVYGVTALGPWVGALSSDGERVTLRDHLGAKVDEVDYDTDFPWPVPPNGDGPSLELVHPTLDNDLGSSWRASSNTAATVSYVTAGSTDWRWRGASSEASTPLTAWRLNGFAEDGTWATGTAPLGSSAQALGIAAPATILPAYGSTYRGAFLRKTFTASGTLPKALLLRVYHNDGAIVWLNGQEIARVAVSTSLVNPPFNNTQLYDNFAGWSEILVTGADTKLLQGSNVLAVEAWGKTPSFRENDTVDDFIIDAELRTSPDLAGTPGVQNSAFALIAAPNIRNVTTTPTVPDANDPAIITARVTDPQGVGSVTLLYQVCPPGGYIPAKLPRTVSTILADPFQPRALNPAFENPANWTSLPMVDDGSGNDANAGDGVFTGTIPSQNNRTLVRYRITVTDLAGSSIRTPYANDPSLNFAYFVYNGVPNYIAIAASVHPDGAGHIYPAAMLTTMPVYHWIMRAADVTQLMAWNGSDQFPNDDNPRTLEARRYYNHEGALVYDGKVYDHVDTRLRGGNSRYNYQGKRHLKFRFQQGSYFQARDQAGKEYPTKWQTMLTNKLFGNIGPADWGITQKIGEQIFNLSGSPMPYSHWFHFRVIDDAAEQPDQYNGDFWGLSQAIEDWDSRFLEAHDLPKGNLYKLTDYLQDGESVGRYLAEDSVQTGEDFDNYRYGAHPAQTESWLNTYVDLPQWFRYNAAAEAVRHYDVFPEPTGRHRLKNWIWYFRPDAANPLGKLVTMPYDLDATFGPTWNSGWDGVHNALYNRATFNDSPTISGAWLPKPNLQIQHRNAVRHLRDLLWQPDQLNAMIDRSLATIEAFSLADRDRWVNGPTAAGTLPANIYWSAAQKAQDMKNFAFTGGNWAQYGGSQPADANAGDNGISGLQGRDAYLDYFADQTGDAPLLPSRPTITYTGTASYPVDGLSFSSSAFADPQGAATFSAMQWRVGEITDATAPTYDPAAEKVYEIADVWVSAELTAFNASVAIPGTALQAGHTYRARVRHKDDTGRWSHWSLPAQFTTTASNYTQVLKDNLMITEFLYQPTAPTAAEPGRVEGDFEYIELTNISTSLTLDLANVRFTKGIDFDFAGSAITSLAPGARVLVVKKAAAFQLRYGSGRPIAGEWDPADNLSNQGEEVKLSFGAGAPIHDFNYLPAAPWPEQPGTGGVSLVLRNPSSRPDHNIAANWRASYVSGGTPGMPDRVAYADWAAPYGGLVELADRDKDGWSNLLEYAFGGNPDNGLSKPSVAVGAQVFNVNAVAGNYLTLTFTRNAIAEDLTMAPEFCNDLSSWTANGVLTSSVPVGNGTVIETWRSSTPISANARAFGRVRVVKQ